MENSRRQYKRYQVPEGILYIFCKESMINGKVTDISHNGLGFQYFPAGNFRPKSCIKIILASDKISVYIPEIPCKIIHDQKANEAHSPYKGSATGRTGVQFEKLDSEMKKKLAEILYCTVPKP